MSERAVPTDVAQRIEFLTNINVQPSGKFCKDYVHSLIDEILLKTQVSAWYKSFSCGLQNVIHSRGPKTSIMSENSHEVVDLIEADQGVKVEEINYRNRDRPRPLTFHHSKGVTVSKFFCRMCSPHFFEC